MKGCLLLGFLVGVLGLLPLRAADESEPHEFRLVLSQIRSEGKAIAYGGFYRLAVRSTHYFNPLNERPGDTTRPVNSREYQTLSGSIFVVGLPGGLADGERWSGWLIRDGAQTFNTDRGPFTLPAFRVVPSPALPPPKPGTWMWK